MTCLATQPLQNNRYVENHVQRDAYASAVMLAYSQRRATRCARARAVVTARLHTQKRGNTRCVRKRLLPHACTFHVRGAPFHAKAGATNVYADLGLPTAQPSYLQNLLCQKPLENAASGSASLTKHICRTDASPRMHVVATDPCDAYGT